MATQTPGSKKRFASRPVDFAIFFCITHDRLSKSGTTKASTTVNAIAPSLTHIYNSSIASGTFPINFKRAKLISVYKKDSVHDRNN